MTVEMKIEEALQESLRAALVLTGSVEGAELCSDKRNRHTRAGLLGGSAVSGDSAVSVRAQFIFGKKQAKVPAWEEKEIDMPVTAKNTMPEAGALKDKFHAIDALLDRAVQDGAVLGAVAMAFTTALLAFQMLKPGRP